MFIKKKGGRKYLMFLEVMGSEFNFKVTGKESWFVQLVNSAWEVRPPENTHTSSKIPLLPSS